MEIIYEFIEVRIKLLMATIRPTTPLLMKVFPDFIQWLKTSHIFGSWLLLIIRYTCRVIQCVPLATEPGISLIILTPIKILQEYVRCVRNEKECVCSVCL